LREKTVEKTADDWNKEGYNYGRLKKYEEAIKCYDQALKIDPYNSKAWNNKGHALEEIGRLGEAIRCYNKALEIDPIDADKIDTYNAGILVDSFVWLEILRGSKKGKIALEIINKSERIFTSVLNLYELRHQMEQIGDKKTSNEYIRAIKSHTKVIVIDEEIALKGALIKQEYKKMGVLNCLILATARINDLKILTGDENFKGIDGVIIV